VGHIRVGDLELGFLTIDHIVVSTINYLLNCVWEIFVEQADCSGEFLSIVDMSFPIRL